MNFWKKKTKISSLARNKKAMKKERLLFFGSILVVLIPITFLIFKNPKQAEAGWWNETWMYRVPVRVTNGDSEDLTNVQVEILSFGFWQIGTKVNNDLSDIRFTTQNGQEIPFWIEDADDDDDTLDISSHPTYDIWLRIPYLPDEGTTVYMYYGNPAATSKSDGDAVFDFFDDFEATSLDPLKWDGTSGTISIADGNLELSTTGTKVGIASKDDFTMEEKGSNRLYIRARQSSTSLGEARLGFSNTKSFSSNYYADDSAAFLFDSTTGGNFEIESVDEGISDQSSMSLRTENTASDIFVVNPTDPDMFRYFTMLFAGSYSASPDSYVFPFPVEDMYVRLENTSTTDTIYVDHVYVGKSVSFSTRAYIDAPTSNEQQSKGPVAYWKLNEGYGSTAHDNRNVYNATLASSTAAPTWKTSEYCVSENCLYLDGSNDYLSVGSTVPSIKTVSFWVKPKDADSTEYYLDLGSNNYIRSITGTLTATGFSSPTIYVDGKVSSTIESNKWQHVVVTTNTAETGHTIEIGKYNSNYFEGFIDEIKFYQYVRTADEIKMDYQSSSSASTVIGPQNSIFLSNGLIGYWKLDESSGEANDSSGNNFTLNNNGTTTFVNGKFNKGSEHVPASTQYLSLDGTAQQTYYFNAGEDQYDTDNFWYDDSNAFDGSTGSNAYSDRFPGDGDADTFALCASGTNVPPTGNTILSVKARTYGTQDATGYLVTEIFDGGSSLGTVSNSSIYPEYDWSAYTTLTEPSPSWTWSGLETGYNACTYMTGISGGPVGYLSKIELLVTTEGEAIEGIKSVSFWANPDDTTNYFLSLTSSAYITSSSGTLSATGFTNPTIYVNGVKTSSIVANTWQYITVTSDTAIDANQFYVGRVGSNYYDGTLDEVRLYNRVLSLPEIKALHSWAPGPVAYFPFDEGSGTSSIYDRSGNNIVGTMNNYSSSSSWKPGKYGKSLQFDGTSPQYISFSSNSNLDIADDITLSAWIKPSSTYTDSGQHIIRHGLSTNQYYGMYYNASTELIQFTWYDGTFKGVSSTTTVPLNTWTHVSLVRSGTNLNIYINGTLGGSGTVTAPTGTNQVFQLGGTQPESGTQDYAGLLDEVKIYNYARSSSQIVEDMNGGHPAPGSPIGSAVGYWKFDENYGDTAYDSSINKNHANLGGSGTTCPSGASASADACPTWSTQGRFGGALSFNVDGTDDYAEVPDSTALRPNGDDYTISFWANPPNTDVADAFISKQETSGDLNRFFVMQTGEDFGNSDGQQLLVNIREDVSNTWYVQSTDDIADGNWHHYTVVLDSNNEEIRLYMDAIQLDTTTDTTGSWPTIDNTEPLRFSTFNAGTGGYSSMLDEIKIFNTALTDAQIKLLYNQSSTISFGVLSTEGTGPATNSAAYASCVPGSSESCGPPIAWWSFDENTGTTTLRDKSGNGYDGTLEGTSENDWKIGKYGSGLSFDGTDTNYVSFSEDTWFDFGDGTSDNAFSISYWFKPIAPLIDQTVISKWGLTNATRAWRTKLSANGSFSFDMKDSSANANIQFDTSPGLVNANEWSHMTFTYDGSSSGNGITIYKNGIKVDGTAATVAGYVAMEPISRSLRIARDHNSYVDGIVDEVKIFDYELSAAQVTWEYNKGKPFIHLKLDECEGATAKDTSGNAYDGTITIGATGGITSLGTCNSGTSTEAWNQGATGKFNASIALDGTDDYVNLGDLDIIDNAEALSVCAWVKHDTITDDDCIFTKREVAPLGGGFKLCRINTGSFRNNTYMAFVGQTAIAYTVLEGTANISTTGNWTHVCATYKESDSSGLRLYINGKEDPNSPADTSEIYNINGDTDSAYIGAEEVATPFPVMTSHLDGQIDDVQVFNYVLTKQQIWNVMNQSSAIRFGD